MTHRRTIRGLLTGALALGTALASASTAAGQQRVGNYPLGPDGEPTAPDIRKPRSAFQLFSGRDRAFSGLFNTGYFRTACLENKGGLTDPQDTNCSSFFQALPNGFQTLWFRELNWTWGVPQTDWNTAKALVPSLANALGGGWTQSNMTQSGRDDTQALDGTLGPYHAGAVSTSDGTCFDHRNRSPDGTIAIGAGNPLLAGSNCPGTWGSLGWVGMRPVPTEIYQAHFASEGSAFQFDFWKVPASELDAFGYGPLKTLGNFQTYGFTSDATTEILAGTSTIRTYGSVIPGGTGAPTRTGWPLGIDVRSDAFSFQLPSLNNIAYYQALFVNNSRRVYGVGLTYDSLYISMNHGWFNDFQSTYVYDVPSMGAIFAVGATVRPCQTAREISDITCSRVGGAGAALGFQRGSAAIVVLKSPIGDLRNKWFTRVGSPYYNPAHVHAGDTLTFTAHHMCGFRACNANTFSASPTLPDFEQRAFGMISSTEANVLGTRTEGGLGGSSVGQVLWHTFRSGNFPNPGSAKFNRYVPPGNWDWNHDGTRDTLALDMCGANGCSGIWSDTTINGKMGAYSNTGGVLSVGPLRFAPGDTTSWVVAFTSALDSASLMAQVAAAIDNYMNFYLGPDPAPKSRIVATESRPNAEGAQVSLFWDESAESFTDPFLLKQYNDLIVSDTTLPFASAVGKLKLLNPRLDDTLLYLSRNNLSRLHLFKSCDGGASWTDDPDCNGDPALGGVFQPLGYQPYASWRVEDGIPNEFTDRNVASGQTYLYNLIGETRGASLQVANGDSIVMIGGRATCVKNCRVETLSLAPSLINSLSASSSEPNVARVYVPISLQAGGRGSRAAVVDSTGPMAGNRLAVTVAADSLRAADYKVRFGIGGRAVMITTRSGQTVTARTTTVTLLGGAAPVVLTGQNIGGVTVSGGTTTTTVLSATQTKDSTAITGGIAVLSLVGAASEQPLLVSTTLLPATTTPGSFFGNPDFPGFTIGYDSTLAGKFNVQNYYNPGGSVIGPLTAPAVTWRDNLSTRVAAATPVSAGLYQLTWTDNAFGPGEPFALDLVNRTQTSATIQASVTARATGQTGDVTATVASRIQTATGTTTTTDSLVAVKVPFTVRNLSFNRNVTIAMRKRPSTGNNILVGFGFDTLRVSIGANEWVPGDRLYFLEPDGAAALQVTFSAAIVGCDQVTFTRTSCNPVRLRTTGASVYLGPSAGQMIRFLYDLPVSPTATFTIRTTGPVRGANLTSDAAAVRAGLSAIRVVPNPYVMVSQYDPDNATRRILFTHMPPRGVLRIFTVSGQFVQQLTWTEADLSSSGDLTWNLRTREANELAAGLYIFVIRATQPNASGGETTIGTRTGKFVVIR